MRVQLLSDLHFEYDDDGGEAFARRVEVAGDVLVLAGDILPLVSPEWVARAFGWFCERFSPARAADPGAAFAAPQG